ncbi:hypothetical protein PO909_031098, partial [Leuciscus waleckii]
CYKSSTITNNKVIFDQFCLSDYENVQRPISRYSGRSFSEQSYQMVTSKRLFTNRLMAKFNMKGKVKKRKLPLETTKTFESCSHEMG